MADISKNYENAPEFIKKLHHLIEVYPDIINFSQDGTEVVIHNEQKFTKKLLPENFRHGQWRSFIRQMNMYNFKKLSRGVKTFIFINPIFIRGNQQNYHLIRRKNNTKTDQQDLQNQRINAIPQQLEAEYGCKSMTYLIDKTIQYQGQSEQLCSQIKKQIQQINKQRKNSQCKQIITVIRDSLQMIEQSANKFKQSANAFSQAHKNMNKSHTKIHKNTSSFEYFDGQLKKSCSNLMIPKFHKNNQVSKIDIFQPIASRTNNVNFGNTLQVTPGCSFSSFQNYLN